MAAAPGPSPIKARFRRKLFAAAKRAAEDPEVKRVAAEEGMIVSTSSSPDEFRRFVENDTARVTATVKALGVKPHEGK